MWMICAGKGMGAGLNADASAHRGSGVLADCTMALDGSVSAGRPSSAARAGNLRRSNGGQGTASDNKPADSSVADMTANPALDAELSDPGPLLRRE
jgi:hypothetical protein